MYRLNVLLLCLLILPHIALAAPKVLFDQSHSQAFLIENDGPLQLGGLADIFRGQGWRVDSNKEALTKETLDGVNALVISGAFSPLAKEEIDAISSYLKKGGKLAVMIHIGQPLTALLHTLGVEFGNLAINDNQGQPDGKHINFAVRALQPHPLTEGLRQFRVYGGWPLRPFANDGKVIASSSPHSWVDMNRDKKLSKGDLMSPFAVMVNGRIGRGEFIVFCDDAIFQNQFLRNGNKALAENLGRWLKGLSSGQMEI